MEKIETQKLEVEEEPSKYESIEEAFSALEDSKFEIDRKFFQSIFDKSAKKATLEYRNNMRKKFFEILSG